MITKADVSKMKRIVNKISKNETKKKLTTTRTKNMKDLKDESRNKINEIEQTNKRKLFTKLPAIASSELPFLKKKF